MATEQRNRQDAEAVIGLQDDLYALSDTDRKRVVSGICSAFGTVLKVVVHVEQAHLNFRAFALVDMSEPAEAERLAAAYNRSSMGTTVLLLLQPRPAA